MSITEKFGIIILIVTTQSFLVDMGRGMYPKTILYFITTLIGSVLLIIG
jgi:hypothetical protein